jgi:hypothetical protein
MQTQRDHAKLDFAGGLFEVRECAFGLPMATGAQQKLFNCKIRGSGKSRAETRHAVSPGCGDDAIRPPAAMMASIHFGMAPARHGLSMIDFFMVEPSSATLFGTPFDAR